MRPETGQNDASRRPDSGKTERAKVQRRSRSIGEAVMEAVEGRRLFSYSADLVGGVLFVRADDSDNNVFVSRNTTQLLISVTSGPATNRVTESVRDPAGNPYLLANVAQLHINTGPDDSEGETSALGNDTVTFVSAVNTPAYIYTGAGTDSVLSGSGNDTIFGASNSDTLKGGNGNDYIEGDGGAGSYTAFTGTVGNNDISGGTGDDTIESGYGNDTVSGDTGADRLRGWTGNDIIYGDGRTTIGSAQTAGDIANSDWIDAGGAPIEGFDDINSVYGGLGNDTIFGAIRAIPPGNGSPPIVKNSLYGDFVTSSSAGITEGDDELHVGAGDNWLYGDSSAASSSSGVGTDYFIMSSGSGWVDGEDHAYGGGGVDTFAFLDDGKVDYVDGGAGQDILQDGRADGNDVLINM